ncbi:MAG TPA: hypothetical protein VFC09_03950 [Candidatus Dormibacteraeota bacterium]|nr:hypothetical protein [Candidatus Dormibacteraeota bacterium]
MTRRNRRLVTAMVAVAAAAPLAALGLPDAARAASLDAFSAAGSGAGVRVVVQSGYSFVVEPDAMLPRAAASIEADTVQALASPLDPGDSVDSLPGLGVPTAEGDVEYSTVNGCCPAPLPALPLPPPPPQLGQTVNPLITTYVAPWNPQLTTPYEHAQVTYPDPTRPGAQQAGFPVGSSGPVPPDFTDLLGLLSAQSSLGSVSASQGAGVADAGAGSAVSVPAMGLHIGRVSSHVDVHGDATGTVSNVVVTLHDVDLGQPSIPGITVPATPGGTALLHIGVLVVSATAQRTAAAAHAVSHSSFEASGVTVAGQAARLDQNGLSVEGSPSPLDAAAQQVIAALNSTSPGCTVQTPVNVPGLGSITSQPSLHVDTPSIRDQLTHNGNEDSVDVNGPTLCIASSVPVPGSNGFAATPTIYSITLGSVSSSAYGVSFPSDGGSVTFSPTLSDTSGSVPGGAAGIDTTTVTNPGTGGSGAGSGPPAPVPSHPAGHTLFAVLTGGILSRRVVVTVAVLAELALLGTLWSSWLLSRGARRRGLDDSPTTRMDLI